MILFVSRAEISRDMVAGVSRDVGMELRTATSLERASQILRQSKCRVAVVDSGLLETDRKDVEQLLEESPSVLPLFPNLAVCGPERLVCEIKAALRRGNRDSQRAAEWARHELRTKLKNSVTAFLLNCDLMLQTPDLPVEVGKKILLLHDLATKMREDLEIEVTRSASA